jgi:predicted ArsR family transcriptional regulator
MVVAEASSDELYASALAQAAGMTRMEAGRQLEVFSQAALLSHAGVLRAGHVGRPAALFRRRDATAWAGFVALGARYRREGDPGRAAG